MDSAEFPTVSLNFHTCDFKTTFEALRLSWGDHGARCGRA